MMEMTRFPRHSRVLCKHVFSADDNSFNQKFVPIQWRIGTNFWLKLYRQH